MDTDGDKAEGRTNIFSYGWNRECTDSIRRPMVRIRSIRAIRSRLFDSDADSDTEPDSDTRSDALARTVLTPES